MKAWRHISNYVLERKSSPLIDLAFSLFGAMSLLLADRLYIRLLFLAFIPSIIMFSIYSFYKRPIIEKHIVIGVINILFSCVIILALTDELIYSMDPLVFRILAAIFGGLASVIFMYVGIKRLRNPKILLS